MADNRDFRVKIDLDFDPVDEAVAREIYQFASARVGKAVNPGGKESAPEIGFVILERNGHRVNKACEIVDQIIKEIPQKLSGGVDN